MNNTLRIIAGEWRGRKLKFAPTLELRPTPNRVRETVFNWLHTYLPRSDCLDLFAGSGALAWEALSRGAQHVTLIDNNYQIVKNLSTQQQILNSQDRSTILHAEALRTIKNLKYTFDIIFIDAPFQQNLVQPCLEIIQDKKLLNKNGYIYVEMEKTNSLQLPLYLTKIKHQIIGQVQFMLLSLTQGNKNE